MEPSTSISFQIYPSSSAFSYSRRRRTRRSSGSCKSLFGLEDHFLDCCHLCKKHLGGGGGGGGGGKDIYMYKGDTPFCSEDCRQEQIDLDETKENNTKQLNQTKKLKNSGPVIYSETKSSRATTTAVSAT